MGDASAAAAAGSSEAIYEVNKTSAGETVMMVDLEGNSIALKLTVGKYVDVRGFSRYKYND